MRKWTGLLLILLIPTFLLNCRTVFGEPWAVVTTLSEAVNREQRHSYRAVYYRVDSSIARVTFYNQFNDQMEFTFRWPIEWGVVVQGCNIRTESGDDPIIIREKYRGNF